MILHIEGLKHIQYRFAKSILFRLIGISNCYLREQFSIDMKWNDILLRNTAATNISGSLYTFATKKKIYLSIHCPNIQQFLPLFTVCKSYNDVCNTLDIFTCSIRTINSVNSIILSICMYTSCLISILECLF